MLERLIWRRAVFGLTVLAALVFVSSGRLDYWQGWIYLDLSLLVLLFTSIALRNKPDLVIERLKPGAGMKSWDKVYFGVSTPLYFAAVVIAGIDAGRAHWTVWFPGGLYIAGILAFIAGQTLFLWAKCANAFFSSVVRIQEDRGQTVCRAGPYRFVRHPGYLAGIVFGLSTPLILGSAWALIPQGLAAALLVGRTVLEDKTLRSELAGYEDYARTVTWRLIPRVW